MAPPQDRQFSGTMIGSMDMSVRLLEYGKFIRKPPEARSVSQQPRDRQKDEVELVSGGSAEPKDPSSRPEDSS